MDSISKLPHELLHNIFKHVDPVDLRSLALTCKEFSGFIAKNKQLFKAIYLNHLDEPEESPKWDWEEELHKFVRFRRVLTGTEETVEEKLPHLEFVSDFVSTMTRSPNQTITSHNTPLLTELFNNRINKEAFLCQSQTFVRSRRDLRDQSSIPPHMPSHKIRQASAKLHTLFGVPIRTPCRTRYRQSYPFAVSMVYDMRNYTEGSLWGPFLPDGMASVDWEKMEAVMIVLNHNMQEFSANTNGILSILWSDPWNGCFPGSYEGLPLKNRTVPRPSMKFEDPYNITGSWMRVVCFLDFHELFHYNFTGAHQPPDVPRPPLETVEAIRLIMMDLHVTKKEEPGPDDGQDLPVVHFMGTARSMHSSWDPNANSNIKGTVRQTKEGYIRWTSISVYNGEERWKSEGIQVGGPKSGRGVLGHWFDREWDMHGPAGPTAFWKISDDMDNREKRSESILLGQDLESDSDDDDDSNFEGHEFLVNLP